MSGSFDSFGGSGSRQTVVIVELPEGREFVWPSPTAGMVEWRAEERVTYRGSRWRVASRVDASETLTFELLPEAGVMQAS
jgi:hypothetical protein